MTTKIDITSTAIEKGIDLAKSFLDKLILPTVEETGLLIKDKVTMWRFSNQVKMLIKAKNNCELLGINPKTISLKVLCPLLDYSGIEENEILQDKWANLLTNMIDSSQNIENHIFPYLLSQISVQEFDELKQLITKENELAKLKNEFNVLKIELDDKHCFRKETLSSKSEIDKIESDGFSLLLEVFEQENLLRLGLIKKLPPKIYIEEFKTGNDNNYESSEQWHQLQAEYDFEDFGYRISELGLKFIETCEIKHKR